MDSPGLHKVQRVVPGPRAVERRSRRQPGSDRSFEDQRREATGEEELEGEEHEQAPAGELGDLGSAEPMEGEAGSNLDVTA